MNKTQLITRLEKTWREFNESFAGLSDGEMLQPGVTEGWSVKDIISHVSWWEEETLNHLPEIAQGIRPQRYSVLFGGIDAFNAMKTEEWRRLTLAEVLTKAADIHRELVDYLQGVPEEYFAPDTKFRRRLRLDTYGHYPIHTRAILAWRGKSG